MILNTYYKLQTGVYCVSLERNFLFPNFWFDVGITLPPARLAPVRQRGSARIFSGSVARLQTPPRYHSIGVATPERKPPLRQATSHATRNDVFPLSNLNFSKNISKNHRTIILRPSLDTLYTFSSWQSEPGKRRTVNRATGKFGKSFSALKFVGESFTSPDETFWGDVLGISGAPEGTGRRVLMSGWSWCTGIVEKLVKIGRKLRFLTKLCQKLCVMVKDRTGQQKSSFRGIFRKIYNLKLQDSSFVP